MTIKNKILELFAISSELSVKEIADKLLVSKQMIHNVLKELLQENKVEKLGRVPKTVYRFTEIQAEKPKSSAELPKKELDFLFEHFLMITETGQMLEGASGFDVWCTQRKLPFEKTVKEFIATQAKYQSYFDKHGFINGMEKLLNTKGYSRIHLDNVCYLDFYAIERFGKTKLGTILHYAKQGQSKMLMSRLIYEIGNKPAVLCKLVQADAVGFVPPTIRREVQLMKFLQTHIRLSLPLVDIKKISGIIPVPQKSLSKLEERITNARNTFMVGDTRSFKHVLLIDDALGSGATMNEIAGKLKQKGVAQQVTGLAITGSFKGFDVITDI